MSLIVVAAVAVWLGLALFVWALCRSAALADRAAERSMINRRRDQ